MSPVTWGAVEVAEFPQYTDEEAKAVWYDVDELDDIASLMWQTVNLEQVNTDKSAKKDDETCTRGLEDMTVQGSLARLIAKYSMDVAVMEGQKKQKETGIYDEEALAEAAAKESRQYVEKAIAHGLKDQEFAERYLGRAQASSGHTNDSKATSGHHWFPGVHAGGGESKKTPRRGLGLLLRRIFTKTKKH